MTNQINLILSLGSNKGNRYQQLQLAKKSLQKVFGNIITSNIYESSAVDYLNQPDFLNQVIEIKVDSSTWKPIKVLNEILKIESFLGRTRTINKGPRNIDIDLLFYGVSKIQQPKLIVPHPRLFERSFIVTPLMELPYYATLSKHFDFSKK